MKVAENSNRLNLLLDELEVAIMVIGRDDGIIRQINHRVCKDLGLAAEDIQNRHYRQLFRPEFISTFDRLQAQCEDGREHTTIYYWAEMVLWEQISARTIVWDSTPCLLVSITHISEMARTEYRFESVASFDNLLRLPNGAKLEEDISDLAGVEPVALIYFEIERFEDVNSLYGWDNGDSLLKQIRDWLLSSERRRAQLYRVNNGFASLGRQTTLADAKNRAREILRRFTHPWALSAGGNSLWLYCTIRLGIVYGQYVKGEMRNILMRTIHAAQSAPRDGYAVYDAKADRRAKETLLLRDMLINCILNDMKGFEVHYQPIVDIRTGRWSALEALCRWTAPDGRAVSPAVFIPTAEQLNLISRVDAWVRTTAMRQCASLRLGQNNIALHVNFSPNQKLDDAFIEELFAALEETGFPAEKLNLEIVESAEMEFDEINLNGLKQLKENGIRLSLDDFGTGYSSFANLINISAAALKTEKLFLDGIEDDSYRQYLLHMLVDIAHYLKMHLVAEGVETREQLELLHKYGVDYAQGFLFSKPLSYQELSKEARRFS